jgi:ribonuclease BN (tRNA processing enzyme)
VRAKIWGCRGSLATPGPETVRYGGNTSCIEVRLADGTLLILDAGTGIRSLGVSLDGASPGVIHLLLSHLHLDHLEGLGFFLPLWDQALELHIWGPSSPMHSLEDRIAIYLSPPLFPVHLSDIPSRLVFHDTPSAPWRIGPATVTAQAISHPGPTVGYRIQEGRRALAYLTDHEPALGVELSGASPDWISGYAIAAGADVLLHDCQYTEEEYAERVGWGHSSTPDVVAFARMCDVGRLLLFHHDPMHSDDDLESMLADVRRLWGPTGDCELASEGLEIEVG